MIRPQHFTAKLADKIILNEKFIQLFFELVEPNLLTFSAGQYASIALPADAVTGVIGERRSYSISSAPEKNHGFELLVDISPKGKGTTYLDSLQFGDEIRFLAPLGLFSVAEDAQTKPLVLIATGSGIAPFMSIVLDELQQKLNKNQITLYWGLRHVEELFWEDEFEELATDFPNFHFHPVISQAVPEWPLCRGRVTDCLSVHELPAEANYYLCGSTSMIKDVIELLIKKRISETQIHHEKFY